LRFLGARRAPFLDVASFTKRRAGSTSLTVQAIVDRKFGQQTNIVLVLDRATRSQCCTRVGVPQRPIGRAGLLKPFSFSEAVFI
jgi:hypothetical protein